MRTFTTRILALAALVAALAACGGSGNPAIDETNGGGAANAVRIVDIGYEPKELTVSAGTTVTWTNTGDLPHSVTSDDGGKTFDSSPDCVKSGKCMAKGDTFSHTFDSAGTFTYMCQVHGAQQTGTVTVTA